MSDPTLPRHITAAIFILHGLPLLALSAIAFAAWLIGDIGDGPTALALLVVIAVLLTVAIHCALVALGS